MEEFAISSLGGDELRNEVDEGTRAPNFLVRKLHDTVAAQWLLESVKLLPGVTAQLLGSPCIGFPSRSDVLGVISDVLGVIKLEVLVKNS
eukprot:5509382-Amphidinium_carterae.1